MLANGRKEPSYPPTQTERALWGWKVAPRPASLLTYPFSLEAFKELKKDPEPGIREFATRQLAFLREVSVESKK